MVKETDKGIIVRYNHEWLYFVKPIKISNLRLLIDSEDVCHAIIKLLHDNQPTKGLIP